MTHMLEQINFHGDLLWAGRNDGEVIVAVKPICDNLTIDWSGQFRRIKRDAILAKGIVIMAIPSPGGVQETICLTLPLVAGWLFGIDDRRIRDPAIREKVLDYKRECHDVLYKHFIGPRQCYGEAPLQSDDDDSPPGLGSHEYAAELALLRECRRLFGVAAARALWKQLDLHDLPEMTPVARQAYNVTACGEAVEAFIADCCVEAPGHRTRLLDLWQAYTAWCAVKGRVPLKLQTVGRHFKERGYPRVKASITHYVGVALKQPEAPQP